MPIDLYYSGLSPPSRAVLMIAKQLSIDVNIKHIDLNKGQLFTPEFQKINPAQSIPTIVDGDITMWEGPAVMNYLLHKYGQKSTLYPKDSKTIALMNRTLMTSQNMIGSFREALMNPLMSSKEPTEQQIKNYKKDLKLMETLIGDHKYVTGDQLTIADISVMTVIAMTLINDYKDLNDYPKLKAWFERMRKELPSFDEINSEFIENVKQRKAAMK